MVFYEDGVWYAAGLEFNIIESGDTPQEALLLLFEALSGYVEAARKIKARPNILNQRADEDYEEMWEARKFPERFQNKRIYAFGELNIRSKSFAFA